MQHEERSILRPHGENDISRTESRIISRGEFEHGTDIRYIQKLLGHESIKTTEVYTHISNKHIAKIRSPFDFLIEDPLTSKNNNNLQLPDFINQKK